MKNKRGGSRSSQGEPSEGDAGLTLVKKRAGRQEDGVGRASDCGDLCDSLSQTEWEPTGGSHTGEE